MTSTLEPKFKVGDLVWCVFNVFVVTSSPGRIENYLGIIVRAEECWGDSETQNGYGSVNLEMWYKVYITGGKDQEDFGTDFIWCNEEELIFV